MAGLTTRREKILGRALDFLATATISDGSCLSPLLIRRVDPPLSIQREVVEKMKTHAKRYRLEIHGLGKPLHIWYTFPEHGKLRYSSQTDRSLERSMYRSWKARIPMVAPTVEGFDLFKIADRSILGWIPNLKKGAASHIQQPFYSQLEERLLLMTRTKLVPS